MDVIKQSFIDLFLIPLYGKDVGLHYGKCLDTEYSLAVVQSCWEAWKLAKTSDKNIEELKKESDHFRLAAKAESERVNELQNEIKKLRKRVTEPRIIDLLFKELAFDAVVRMINEKKVYSGVKYVPISNGRFPLECNETHVIKKNIFSCNFTFESKDDHPDISTVLYDLVSYGEKAALNSELRRIVDGC